MYNNVQLCIIFLCSQYNIMFLNALIIINLIKITIMYLVFYEKCLICASRK